MARSRGLGDVYKRQGYSSFGLSFNLINLGCNIISGAILGGLFSRYLANRLAKAGVLNQFRICADK
jgi:ABC-type thiamin/hydroxymethylpyrimidine transport system permease subunit